MSISEETHYCTLHGYFLLLSKVHYSFLNSLFLSRVYHSFIKCLVLLSKVHYSFLKLVKKICRDELHLYDPRGGHPSYNNTEQQLIKYTHTAGSDLLFYLCIGEELSFVSWENHLLTILRLILPHQRGNTLVQKPV